MSQDCPGEGPIAWSRSAFAGAETEELLHRFTPTHPRPDRRGTGRRSALALLLLLSLALGACSLRSSKSKPKCPIKIGVVTSLTGSNAAGGCEHVLGYEMALQEINEAGGVLGCELELLVEDDASSTRDAQLAVRKLAETDDVVVILGAYSSGATLPAASVAEVYEVPFVVPTASSDLITQRDLQWLFRINAPASDYASTAMRFVMERLGTSATLAIAYEDTFFGESGAVAAATNAAEYGIQLVAYEKFEPGSSDYTTILSQIKAAAPDVVYFVANSEADAVQLMRESREEKLNPKVFLGHAGGFVIPQFITEADGAAEYSIATAQWATDVNWAEAGWADVDSFTQQFLVFALIFGQNRKSSELYGQACVSQAIETARPGMRIAQTYTTLYVVKDAITRAAEDESVSWQETSQVRLAVRNALKETNLKTVFGPIKFDETGQNSHQVLLTQVIGGIFVTVYPPEYTRNRAPVVPIPAWVER